MKTIDAQQLKDKLGSVALVNVLDAENFSEKRIPSSINLPVDEVAQLAPKVLPDKSQEIVVYCASTECQASPSAAKKLIEMGYTNVADFEAGVAGWEDAGFEFD